MTITRQEKVQARASYLIEAVEKLERLTQERINFEHSERTAKIQLHELAFKDVQGIPRTEKVIKFLHKNKQYVLASQTSEGEKLVDMHVIKLPSALEVIE